MPCARPCSSSTSTASSRSTIGRPSAGDSILLTLSRRLGRLREAAGHAGAHRRRRIRRHPALGAGARSHHRLRRDDPARRDDADHLCRARDLPDRLHRPRPVRPADRVAPRGLKNAEIAMVHAKRQGGDRIEVFRPTMRSDRSDDITLESDLRVPSTVARSRCCSSRSSASRTARSPASSRCCAGTIRGSGAWGRTTSCRSRRRRASSSTSACSCWSAPPASSPPGRRARGRPADLRQRSTCRAAISCATISCTT